MDTQDLLRLFTLLVGLLGLLVGIFQKIWELRGTKEATERVREAEKEAFKERPQELADRITELSRSQEGLEERATEIRRLVEESQESVAMGRLFNLYSRQIEQYQQQTQARATWSFIFAILAMSAGLAFVVWGGSVLLSAKEAVVLTSGGLIAALGGGVSAFITKTFLDVHRVSLRQLNRYFQQPVINDHILMAQRIADQADDPESRTRAYDRIIESIATLIRIAESDDDGA